MWQPTYRIMKKTFFTLALLVGILSFSQAQQVLSSSSLLSRDFSNEIKVNFLNLIVLGSVEVGYERYLSETHSLDFQVHINDRFGYNSEAKGKEYKTNSIQTGMNFYFGNGESGRFYLFPFAKIRFGDFEENNDGDITTTDMTAFIFGAGLGYKWEVTENFAFGPYASIARGFSDEVANKFTRIEPNAGFSLGYRF